MAITYANQRVLFDILTKKYHEYVALYRVFNNGSLVGVAGFDEFYWRMTYFTKYDVGRSFSNPGY